MYSHTAPCILTVAKDCLKFFCVLERVHWVYPKHELNWLLSASFSYPFVSKYDWISHLSYIVFFFFLLFWLIVFGSGY
jgi:hypothetical protein